MKYIPLVASRKMPYTYEADVQRIVPQKKVENDHFTAGRFLWVESVTAGVRRKSFWGVQPPKSREG
jgi:hypothetical protein